MVASAPPAPIVRAVPPGMEQIAAQRAAEAAPKPAEHWRSGFTLRASFGVGSYVVADGGGTERDSSTVIMLGLGGFPVNSIAVMLHLEGTSGGSRDLMAKNLGFMGLSADYFITDKLMLGAGVGQTTMSEYVLEADGFLWPEERDGFGAQGRAGYVLTQRRKHAVDLTG